MLIAVHLFVKGLDLDIKQAIGQKNFAVQETRYQRVKVTVKKRAKKSV
jgi:hypothetical protein